jgi:Nif-specific regulatory protein
MLNHVMPFNFQKMHMPQETVTVPEKPKETTKHANDDTETYKKIEEQASLTKSSLQEMEKEAIIQSLIENRGIQTKAAKQLGMSARQIGYKIKKYNIEL